MRIMELIAAHEITLCFRIQVAAAQRAHESMASRRLVFALQCDLNHEFWAGIWIRRGAYERQILTIVIIIHDGTFTGAWECMGATLHRHTG